MKFKILLGFLLFILFYHFSYSQRNFIRNVPDYSQPPGNTLTITYDATNYCAPFAFLNIVSYWDSVRNHPYAYNIMAGLTGMEVVEYIGWHMDTNDQGSPQRFNGNPNYISLGYPSSRGTYVLDQWVGAWRYIDFDTTTNYYFPLPVPPEKRRYDWDFHLDSIPDFNILKDEIDSGNPVKLDFYYWNIHPSGDIIYDPALTDDSIYVYEWGTFVDSSGSVDEQDPVEEWINNEGMRNIGHAVTAVGYLEDYKPDTLWVIVHDNWSNTAKDIVIPYEHISAWISVHLPEPPDLTITNSDALTDTSIGVLDSLWINEPISVLNTIKNIGPGAANSFIVDVQVLDHLGVTVSTDTIKVSQLLNTNDSLLVLFDSLFTATAAGNYQIISRVHWDQNSDHIINDPDDLNPQNDSLLIIASVYSNIIYQPLTIIANVPDINQPPATSLASTIPNNFCAPIAAVNITTYWDVVVGHSNAIGVNAGFKPDTVAEYIGWFMDTNNKGNPLASNGLIYPKASGTYTIDQYDFFAEYIRWDLSYPYTDTLVIPPEKNGYEWTFSIDYQSGIPFYQDQIDDCLPPKVDFLYWNINYTDTMVVDTVTQDTVYLYSWGEPVANSGIEPWEEWNHFEWDEIQGPENIGHAVTGVGYFTYKSTFYAVVHDNWPGTHKEVAIPWQNWVATISVDPTIPVDITENIGIPNVYRLDQNFPNPFNPVTKISYQLPKTSDVELVIYNILGQKITTLVSEKQTAGIYNYEWNAGSIASGIYICRLQAGDYVKLKKMVLLK